VDVLTTVHDRALAGRPVAPIEVGVWEVTSIVVLALLLPAVMTVARRQRLTWPPRPRVLAIHLVCAFTFSLVHVLGMGLMRSLIFSAAHFGYDPLKPLADWPYELRKDLVTYAALVGSYTTWLRIGPSSAPAPAELPALLEVRDGARRVYLQPGDILWVEAAGNYVQIHAVSGVHLHRVALAELEARFADLGLVRIHRSRLVRRDAITAVEARPSGDFEVALRNGDKVTGSRRFRAVTRLDRAASAD